MPAARGLARFIAYQKNEVCSYHACIWLRSKQWVQTSESPPKVFCLKTLERWFSKLLPGLWPTIFEKLLQSESLKLAKRSLCQPKIWHNTKLVHGVLETLDKNTYKGKWTQNCLDDRQSWKRTRLEPHRRQKRHPRPEGSERSHWQRHGRGLDWKRTEDA